MAAAIALQRHDRARLSYRYQGDAPKLARRYRRWRLTIQPGLCNPAGNPLIDLVGEPADSPWAEVDGLGEPPVCHGHVQSRLLEAAPTEDLVAADDLQWPALVPQAVSHAAG